MRPGMLFATAGNPVCLFHFIVQVRLRYAVFEHANQVNESAEQSLLTFFYAIILKWNMCAVASYVLSKC